MKTTNILRRWISAAVVFVNSTGPAWSADPTAFHEVKIGYTSTSTSVFPIEFARRKGFLREEGLNIVMIVMRTNVIMNALLTRGIDYGTPATSVIRAAASDLPVKAVAVLTGRPDYFLAAKKEFKSLKDLKGKRIAIGTFGAAADMLFEWCSGKRVGPGARRYSFAVGRGRFAFRRPGWRNRRRDCSEFSI